MGRKSKKELLIKFIVESNFPSIRGKSLRVKRKKILSDPKLNIAKSTLYKLINETPYLSISGEDVVFSQDEQERELLLDLYKKIYNHYDPQIGQKTLRLSDFVEPHVLDSPDLLEKVKDRLLDLDKIYGDINYSSEDNEVSFTSWGASSYLEKKDPVFLCKVCLKALKSQAPIIFSTSRNEFYEDGAHCGCFATDTRSGSWTNPLSCGYCGLPLSPVKYEEYLQEYQFDFLNTTAHILSKMPYDKRDLLIKLAITNFKGKNSKDLKEAQIEYRKIEKERWKITEDEETRGGIEKWRKGEEEEIFVNLSEFILEQFFEDFKKGTYSREIDESQIMRSVVDYQIAEYIVLKEQKELINTEIKNFIDFTGLHPYLVTDSQNIEPSLSLIESDFPMGWSNIYRGFSEHDQIFHPNCFERYKLVKQNNIEEGS